MPPIDEFNNFSNFLSIAASVLGGALLQVFLSPPAAVTDSAIDNPDTFGWCLELQQCSTWQHCWQLSCVVAFCFVILSIICCGTASVVKHSGLSLATAVLFFFAAFLSTSVAVLSTVFLSASKSTALATTALLVALLLASAFFGWEGLALGLDEVVLAPLLFRAAAAGDATAVRRFIRLHASMDWPSSNKERACYEGKSYFLAERGGGSGTGASPLHVAVCCRHMQAMHELVLHGANVNFKDRLGSTPLHLAAANLDYGAVKFLLGHGADPWSLNNEGWTPLLAAMGRTPKSAPAGVPRHASDLWRKHLKERELVTAPDKRQEERLKTVELLLGSSTAECCIDVISPVDRLTALQLAVMRCWTPVVELLLEAGATVDVAGTRQSTLGLACITPSAFADVGLGGDLVERLILHRASVDFQDRHGDTPLHICIEHLFLAAHANETDRMKIDHIFDSAMVLLTSGASVNVRNQATDTPLMRAVVAPGPLGVSMTTMLLNFHPDLDVLDDNGKAALHHAIDLRRNCNVTVVELLLIAGADPQMLGRGRPQVTPLQLAAQQGNVAVARLLVQHGADVNFFPPITPYEASIEAAADRLVEIPFDAFGHIGRKVPPLMHAITYKKDAMVKFLLEAGADLKETGGSSWPTPLFHAAANGTGTMVKSLVQAGAKYQDSDADGDTPLHIGAMECNPEPVRALLEAGANPFTLNKGGQRAIDMLPLPEDLSESYRQRRKRTLVLLATAMHPWVTVEISSDSEDEMLSHASDSEIGNSNRGSSTSTWTTASTPHGAPAVDVAATAAAPASRRASRTERIRRQLHNRQLRQSRMRRHQELNSNLSGYDDSQEATQLPQHGISVSPGGSRRAWSDSSQVQGDPGNAVYADSAMMAEIGALPLSVAPGSGKCCGGHRQEVTLPRGAPVLAAVAAWLACRWPLIHAQRDALHACQRECSYAAFLQSWCMGKKAQALLARQVLCPGNLSPPPAHCFQCCVHRQGC